MISGRDGELQGSGARPSKHRSWNARTFEGVLLLDQCLTREEKAAFLSASGKKDIISWQRAARNKKSVV